jgi:hypothetical protein
MDKSNSLCSIQKTTLVHKGKKSKGIIPTFKHAAILIQANLQKQATKKDDVVNRLRLKLLRRRMK